MWLLLAVRGGYSGCDDWRSPFWRSCPETLAVMTCESYVSIVLRKLYAAAPLDMSLASGLPFRANVVEVRAQDTRCWVASAPGT